MTAIGPVAMIDMTDTAAWILIAMGALNNGNATAGIEIGMDASSNGSEIAAPLLILIMVETIGAMIVIRDIGTVSIGKLGTIEYSRILKRGRGIAAARAFVSGHL